MNIEDKNPDLKSSFQKGLITGLLICSLFALIFLFVAKRGNPSGTEADRDRPDIRGYTGIHERH